ncbi:hypothetical protein HY227_00915 [Candidatus Wolfebacteria bacterium]|nr:hypothetical protein [Candidatus Wolfebacteria bacterium]
MKFRVKNINIEIDLPLGGIFFCKRFLGKFLKKKLLEQSGRAAIIFIVFIYALSPYSFSFRLNKSHNPEQNSANENLKPNEALATYQFVPTNGAIVTGTATSTSAAQAISTTVEVNTGSWKGALADDNAHWVVLSTTSGINVNLSVGRVQLNGANSLIIQTEIDEDATSPSLLFQICDWTSSTGVDAAADAQCTGGGWRTLNVAKTAVVPTVYTAYNYQIYDGYWGTGSTGGTPISTPLTNFVNGSNEIKIRYYSTTNTTTPLGIDYLRVYAVVNPIYSAAGFTNLGYGTPIGSYASTTIGVGQTGSDDLRLQVPGQTTSTANFYLSFKNIKTYTGMNTILVRAEYSCSATDISHRPKIWNFTSSSWEDLTTASIACSATDATNAWAKNNITISDYVSSGEARIGWYGLSNATTALRIDLIYIMLGTTNSGASDYEISFGTNSAGDVTNTRNLDMTGVTSTWNIATEDESVAMGHDYYPYNTDMDAVVEEAAAANITMSVAPPANSAVTGIFFAGRFMGGTGGTVQMGIRDYGGFTGTLGGWAAVGATATTGHIYTDNVTVGTVTSGGIAGYTTNPEDFADTLNNKMNINLRTTADSASSTNAIRQWDFAMTSIQWVETGTASTISCSTDSASTAFGNLTDLSIFTSSPNASTTMSCDSGAGCTLYIKDAGSGSNPGLWNSTSSALIESPNAAYSASTTLAAGTEGYGTQATTTATGSGGTLGVNSRYNSAILGINGIGGLTTSTQVLASSTAAITNREIITAHKAATSSTTPTGDYNDTITYSCLGN